MIKRGNNIDCFYCEHHLSSPYRKQGDMKDYCALTKEWILSSGGSCENYEHRGW